MKKHHFADFSHSSPIKTTQCLLAFLLIQLVFTLRLSGQASFDYSVAVRPMVFPGLPGLHSFAVAQHNGRWLIIGGRTDGVHARQPFNAFPQSQNNTSIYVIDPATQQFWTMPVDSLPVGLSEQLQSTNMSFYQDEDTLYLIGGYCYSATANDHITFPNLATVHVSGLMNAIINGLAVSPYFRQITDNAFAVTGGQLGKIGNKFYLVGGHRFDGRYNPMGGPTYTQTYTNQIRTFEVTGAAAQLSFSNYTAITDPVHLHRRDYNLLPQIFPDGSEGYTISSGVFQLNVDLPFLYPVDITASGYQPVTTFNQYLSNYHSAKVGLYDSVNNQMNTLFFGGISQYYYQNKLLLQDNQVPFVKTISRLTRHADGSLGEYVLPVEMPLLTGAGAEFILNMQVPHTASEIILLNAISGDSVRAGYIYGGISSSAINPFVNNQTGLTSAASVIYEVWLIRQPTAVQEQINGENPYTMRVFPNPATADITVSFTTERVKSAYYYLTAMNGTLVQQGALPAVSAGLQQHHLKLPESPNAESLQLTVVLDGRFCITQEIIRQ